MSKKRTIAPIDFYFHAFDIVAYMAIDWTKIYQKYKGLWVALEDDEVTVIASGSTLQEALQKARAQGRTMPILFRVPTKIMPYVGVAIV